MTTIGELLFDLEEAKKVYKGLCDETLKRANEELTKAHLPTTTSVREAIYYLIGKTKGGRG